MTPSTSSLIQAQVRPHRNSRYIRRRLHTIRFASSRFPVGFSIQLTLRPSRYQIWESCNTKFPESSDAIPGLSRTLAPVDSGATHSVRRRREPRDPVHTFFQLTRRENGNPRLSTSRGRFTIERYSRTQVLDAGQSSIARRRFLHQRNLFPANRTPYIFQ